MTVKNENKRRKMVFRMMSIKRPTGFDKIIEKVEKPEGAIPNVDLPKWKELPLESKIPMVPGPKDAYVFGRKKLGETLWSRSNNSEFNLSDPYNNEFSPAYNPLHDEHLATHFAKDRNRRHLLDRGFISEDLDAICTLRDYNEYRLYLNKLHRESVKKEIEHAQNIKDQRRVLGFTDYAAKKENERLKKEERNKMAKAKIREGTRLLRKKQREGHEEAADKFKKRLESVEEAKEKERKIRISKSRARTEKVKQNKVAISEMNRDQMIRAVIRWARRDEEQKNIRKERLARQADEKRKKIEKSWEHRKTAQISEMLKNEEALNFAQEEREKFIKRYTSKVQKAQRKFQRRVKDYHRFLTCYLTRRVTGNATCCQRSIMDNNKQVAKLSPEPSIKSEMVENDHT